MDIKERARKFAEEWKGRGYEKGESQIFWLSLLQDVYGVEYFKKNMGKYTISKEITDIELKNIYEIEKKKFSFKSIKDLDYIFEIALKNRDRFPSVNIKEANPQKYIEKIG